MQVIPSVDPFITKVFMGLSIIPKAIPNEISWDEKQEQARVARERKRYLYYKSDQSIAIKMQYLQ